MPVPEPVVMPSALQQQLQRAVQGVLADSAAQSHPFIKALCRELALPNLQGLEAALVGADPYALQLQFGAAVQAGYGVAAGLAHQPADTVRQLAIALCLCIAERLAQALHPTAPAVHDAPVALDDACLAAIAAAGWLGMGLALVWNPGQQVPKALNLVTDVSEQQLSVADGMDVLNLEVRKTASDLLGLPAPSGAGPVGARRALLERLERERGLKPVVALRAGAVADPAAAPGAWKAAQGRLQAELGVELFRYGPQGAELDAATRQRWKEHADELQTLLGYLRGAFPQPMAASGGKPRQAIFISYARENLPLFNEVYDQLSVLKSQGVELWGDVKKINTGDRWEDLINEGLEGCTLAVLLVSAKFNTSSFIARKELPRLQQRAQLGQLRLYPVLASTVATALVPWLHELQIFSKTQALDRQSPADRAAVLAAMVNDISKLLAEGPPPAQPQQGSA